MSSLGRYIFSSVTHTNKFQRRLDSHQVWKNLFLYENIGKWRNQQMETMSGQPAVHIDASHSPSSLRAVEMQSQKFIEKQIIHLLFSWRNIDNSHPNSHQIYKERYGEEYHTECEEEENATHYKEPFDRSKTNMSELWDKVLLDDNNMGKVDHQDQGFREFIAEQELVNPRVKEFSSHHQSNKSLENLERMRAIEQERMQKLMPAVKEQIGWCPRVDRSSIKNAGLGLFIDGMCRRGTVIGIYPGMTYNTTIAKKIRLKNGHVQKCVPGNDGIVYINGQLWNEKFFETMYNHQTEIADDEPVNKQKTLLRSIQEIFQDEQVNEKLYGHLLGNRFIHPFAQLHRVNHPRPGFMPNVVASPLIVQSKFPPSLLCYLPNKHFKAPYILLEDFGMIKTVVYIAERDLHDEEVFVDYRFNPNDRNLPAWYAHVDLERDRRTWLKA